MVRGLEKGTAALAPRTVQGLASSDVRRRENARATCPNTSSADSSNPTHRVEYVQRTELLGRIVSTLRSLPDHLCDPGRRALRNVRHHTWDPRLGQFLVTFVDATSKTDDEEAETQLPVDVLDGDQLSVKARCPCRTGASGHPCHHAYAGLYYLYDELSTSDEELPLELPEAGPTRQPWESRLEDLDRLLESRAGVATKDRQTSRLAWRVRVRRGVESTVEIEALEQRPTRNGWSSGRRVTAQRVLETSSMWSRISDGELAGKLANETVRRGVERPDAYDLLERLIGHPNVVDDDNCAMEIEAGKVSVTLGLRSDGRLHLTPTVDGIDLEEALVFQRGVVLRRRDRLVVAPADATRRALVDHLLGERAFFPREAQEAVLERLPAIETLLPVELGEDLDHRSVAADERVHVLLTPAGDTGVRVAIRFRPLPSGAYWPPGDGLETYGRIIDSCWVKARRDLALEQKIANRVVAKLRQPSEETEIESVWSWTEPTPEDALRLLEKLAELRDEVVVAWPEGGELQVVGRLSLGALRVNVTREHDLFGVDGWIEIDESQVDLTTLLACVRRDLRFVQLDDGRWASISDDLRDRLRSLAEVSHGDDTKLSPAAVHVVDTSLDGAIVDADPHWETLRDRLREGSIQEATPEIEGAELRSYQLDGFRWMHRLADCQIGACLADDMGLGKTVQTLSVLSARASTGPALVVAPTSVTTNWVRECQRFTPWMRPQLYSESDRTAELELEGGDLVVISYGLLRRDVERLQAVQWGTLVLDEAQSVKNSRSQTALAVNSIRASWRLALTGTPIENHLGELWSLFRFLSPGLLGSWESFKRRFAEPIEKEGNRTRRDALSRLTRPFILRRTKSKVLTELPPRTDVTLRASLSVGERALYEETRAASVAWLRQQNSQKKTLQRFDVLAALTRLRQLSCHPRLVHKDVELQSAKLNLLMELVETLRAEGHRALVFSQFTQFLDLISTELEQRSISHVQLDGRTSARERARRVDAFQGGEADVFLISLKAGGTGLNLTAADYVIHMDPWWNPAVEDQATDRAHRFGQTRPVTVYRLVAEGTIEEEIARMQASKRELIASMLEGTDAAARLSDGELLSLLESRPEIDDETAES